MHRTLVVLLVALLAGCAAPRIAIDYRGDDRGTAVVGLGATDTDFQSWTLNFRRRDDPTHAIGSFYYQKRGLVGRLFGGAGVEPDYQSEDDARGEEHGVVLVATLAPGDYEIYRVAEHYNGGQLQIDYWSNERFAVPFTVVAGGMVYLGNYQATSFKGRSFIGINVTKGAYYAVEDRRDADLAIAAKKGAPTAGSTVVDATPSPASLSGITLITTAERDRRYAASRAAD